MTSFDDQMAMLGQVPATLPKASAPVPAGPPGYVSPFAPGPSVEELSEPGGDLNPNGVQVNDIVHPDGTPARSFVVRQIIGAQAEVANNNGCGCGGTFTYPLSTLIVDGHIGA